MVFDGAFGDVEGVGDFAVAGSGGEEFEDFAFAGGEVVEGGGGRWGGRSPSQLSGELAEDAGAELGVALVGGANGIGKGFGGGVFEEVADGSFAEGGGDIFIIVEGGEDEDFWGRAIAPMQSSGGGDPIHPWHPNVHQHHIGVQDLYLLHRCFATVGFADHRDVRLQFQQGTESLANQVLVIHNERPDYRCFMAEIQHTDTIFTNFVLPM